LVVADPPLSRALADERFTLAMFVVTIGLSLLMVSNFRFRSFKDLRLNARTVFLVLFTIGTSVFIWQRYKPQLVLVWLLSVYILIGIVESLRAFALRLRGLDERDSVPPAQARP
jgi:CDP-diacylglycerol--serine O-phosphatidyltransferase